MVDKLKLVSEMTAEECKAEYEEYGIPFTEFSSRYVGMKKIVIHFGDFELPIVNLSDTICWRSVLEIARQYLKPQGEGRTDVN